MKVVRINIHLIAYLVLFEIMLSFFVGINILVVLEFVKNCLPFNNLNISNFFSSKTDNDLGAGIKSVVVCRNSKKLFD